MSDHLLTLVIFAPLGFALLAALLPGAQSRIAALVGSFASLGLTLWLYLAFDAAPGAREFQFEQYVPWIESLGIGYHVGVDGLSVSLMLLTAALSPIVLLSTMSAIQARTRELSVALMVLQSAMLGTFAALDLALFFVFWEALLVPMYLLVGLWGSENRIYAAVKFFVFTFVGSLMMLVAILWLHLASGSEGARTFDYVALLNTLNDPASAAALSLETKRWLFLAFALAFAVKVPLFPLHTWLPDAHTEAPAAGSIVLAGVLLKMGVYGFLRFAMPLFPEAAAFYRPLFVALAVIGILYGSLMSFAQRDMKRLVAYSSVAHLGFVMLGVFALTVTAAAGSILQMINHGISTGALFLLIGILYERTHTRVMADYGGLAKLTPGIAVALLVITLSSIGLPLTNGFVGEFLILSGTFTAPVGVGSGAPINTPLVAGLASLGVLLGAVYMLRMYQRVMLGPVRHEGNRHLRDLTVREWATVLPLMLLAVGMGLFPQPFLTRLEPSAQRFVQRVTVGPVAVPSILPAQPAPTAQRAK